VSGHEAVIVGGGPAGLSAARTLLAAGVRDVLVLEREAALGGLPRQCEHRGFGVSQYGWPYTGPDYAARLRREAAGARLRTGATVVGLHPGGVLEVATAEGLAEVRGRCVLLATGIRESPGPARLVSGARPWGVLTTGALQRFVALGARRPCRRAVVIGSEWVALSALLTLRRAGIAVVAVLEEGERVTVPRPAAALARLAFRAPLLTGVAELRVRGAEVVEGIEFTLAGRRRALACDAVVFTGRFVPEAALVRECHLELDAGTGGPVIDQHWRCSDPAFFAAGNLLRPVETSGVAGREGVAAARAMARALRGELAAPRRRMRIAVRDPLRYVYPQVIATPGEAPGALLMRARVSREARGTLLIRRNGRTVWRRALRALPERRIRLPGRFLDPEALESVEIILRERERDTKARAGDEGSDPGPRRTQPARWDEQRRMES